MGPYISGQYTCIFMASLHADLNVFLYGKYVPYHIIIIYISILYSTSATVPILVDFFLCDIGLYTCATVHYYTMA